MEELSMRDCLSFLQEITCIYECSNVGNTGIDKFFNVEKFTLTPLSLPLSCNFSCPTVGLKILLPMYSA
jgi:hypothetical protein